MSPVIDLRFVAPRRPTAPHAVQGSQHQCCPRSQHADGSSANMISRLIQGLVSAVYASRATLPTPIQDWLPVGGLRICREGAEPSGSDRKVHAKSILLSRIYPDAKLGAYEARLLPVPYINEVTAWGRCAGACRCALRNRGGDLRTASRTPTRIRHVGADHRLHARNKTSTPYHSFLGAVRLAGAVTLRSDIGAY
jgi:hypothetical protein